MNIFETNSQILPLDTKTGKYTSLKYMRQTIHFLFPFQLERRGFFVLIQVKYAGSESRLKNLYLVLSFQKSKTAQKKHFYPGSSDEASDALDQLDELLYLQIRHSTNPVLEEKLPSSSVLHLCIGKTPGLTSIPIPR